MRAKLLSNWFCLLHSLVKYHFSINRLIANSKIGAFATGNYLLQHDHTENILLINISNLCSWGGGHGGQQKSCSTSLVTMVVHAKEEDKGVSRDCNWQRTGTNVDHKMLES